MAENPAHPEAVRRAAVSESVYWNTCEDVPAPPPLEVIALAAIESQPTSGVGHGRVAQIQRAVPPLSEVTGRPRAVAVPVGSRPGSCHPGAPLARRSPGGRPAVAPSTRRADVARHRSRGLRSAVAAAGLGVLGLWAPTAAGGAPTPPEWETWLAVPGVVDVAGPRADGALIVATAGGLLAVPTDRDTTPGPAEPTGMGSPTAIALSPGLDVAGAACRFGAGEVFALDASTSPPAVVAVDATGQGMRFAELAQFERLTGIAFDTTGRFGNRLLVAGRRGDRTGIVALDCRGQASSVTEDAPHLDGGIAVAPERFGDFGGDLIGVEEGTGEVVFVRADATSGVVVATGLPTGPEVGPRSLGFVPEGFNRRGGSAFVADAGAGASSRPRSGGLRRLSSEGLAPIGIDDNDLLVAGGVGGPTVVVRCREGCRVLPLGRTPGGDVQGRIAVVLDPPAQPVKPPANPAGSRVFVVVTGVLILGGFVLFLRHNPQGRKTDQPSQPARPAPGPPPPAADQ